MENLNSVAYINKINKIEPIAGADKLELATVNGWTSVVQKGIHTEGDLVLCITTDAMIPEDLSTKWNVKNYLRSGYRVRTVKLRGSYSECILMPLKEIGGKFNSSEGSDLMDELHIFKYEPAAREINLPKGRKVKYKDNPNFHIYYKFPNQKNVPNMFQEGDQVSITRKLHGTNARYGIIRKTKLSIMDRVRKFFGNEWVEYDYIYGSHNVEKGSDSQGFYSTDVWKEVADRLDIKTKLWALAKDIGKDQIGSGIIIYGEIYGHSIQGDKYSYGLKTKEFAGFDIELNGEYQNNEFNDFVFSSLYIECVPELYLGPWNKEVQDSFVFNQYISNTSVPHEGVVVKCITGDRKKVSKVINPEYHTYSEKFLVPDSH